MKFFSLILAENPQFFPDFPDWKKSSKFSLNSLIGGNPDHSDSIENCTGRYLPRNFYSKTHKVVDHLCKINGIYIGKFRKQTSNSSFQNQISTSKITNTIPRRLNHSNNFWIFKYFHYRFCFDLQPFKFFHYIFPFVS